MIIEAGFSPGMTLAECQEVARLAEEARVRPPRSARRRLVA
jgi:hypothetical protein